MIMSKNGEWICVCGIAWERPAIITFIPLLLLSILLPLSVVMTLLLLLLLVTAYWETGAISFATTTTTGSTTTWYHLLRARTLPFTRIGISVGLIGKRDSLMTWSVHHKILNFAGQFVKHMCSHYATLSMATLGKITFN